MTLDLMFGDAFRREDDILEITYIAKNRLLPSVLHACEQIVGQAIDDEKRASFYEGAFMGLAIGAGGCYWAMRRANPAMKTD